MKHSITELAVIKFTNSIMERIRCLKLEGKTFKKDIPTREQVSAIVLPFIDDENKFVNECWTRHTALDIPYTSTEALFLAQPSGFSAEIVDDYFTGRIDKECEDEGGEPWTLEDLVRSVIANALDIAGCCCHNTWDKDDEPNDVQFNIRKMTMTNCRSRN